ncbi:hypothetical protein F383_16723 [Gossypium arboreum]|uniref:Uncharacterized protein n=1 Tax=Gossypium arboreum TaxID=29729 RepID=A0A0B0NIP8_GOSAR|nr:hypothetical protein F383_16723 [Gossypium arboreum]
MSGTCIRHIMRASVKPCLGHGIGIETSTSLRHVWDMHRPRDCKTMSGTWHRQLTPCLRLWNI